MPRTIDAATKATGVESLTSITFAGSASTGNFGQSQSIEGPGGDDRDELHAHDRPESAGVACDQRHDAAADSRRAAAAAGHLEPEHHAGERRLDAAARNLGDAEDS